MTVLAVFRSNGQGTLELVGWFEDSIPGQSAAKAAAAEGSGFVLKISGQFMP